MATSHVIFLSVAGLRHSDIDPQTTPTLYDWANRGVLAELKPTFPCVTSTVQANMWTGTGPAKHGVIANGFYHRDRREVEFWVGRNGVIKGEQIWDALAERTPSITSATWHTQNIKDAAADFIVTPAPIHEPDGSMKLWCYSKPEGLYQALLDDLGHFPLQHYWGPMSNLESTRWILRGAAWLVEKHAPNFHWIYIPHLDYAAQKHGPNSLEAKQALTELDKELATFEETVSRSAIGQDVVYLVAGEYALTEVNEAIVPNRILREAGLLQVIERDDGELIDFENSAALAMVDHQLAHVYIKADQSGAVEQVRELFEGLAGIDGVYAGDARREIGLDHSRSGEVVLVTKDTHWLAYYWWLTEDAAPTFARTVDIHRKPGYDPLELFFDPATKGISLDTSLIKGSHGVPATQSKHRTVLIGSKTTPALEAGNTYRDTDIKNIVLDLFG